MRNILNMLFIILIIISYAFANEEIQNAINADTLQGFTSFAFMTTNDFESLKVTKVFLIDINSPQNSVIEGGNGSIE